MNKIILEKTELNINIYYQNNQQYFNELLNLINTSKSYGRSLRCTGAQGHSKDRRYLLNWILSCTKMLGNTYTLATRCYWILHGYTDFPKCWNFDECHNKLNNQNVSTVYDGYRTCSCSLACRHKIRVQHTQQSLIDQYGVINVFQLESVKEKCKVSYLKNLSVENPSQSDEVKIKKEQTCFNNYGVKHPLQSIQIMQKYNNTCLDRYGVKWPMQNIDIFNKSISSIIDKYGVSCIWYNQDVMNKRRDTLFLNYGVEWPMQSRILMDRSIDFYQKKYGVSYGMQVPEIRKKANRKYLYNDRSFDSAPELAYYIWLSDNGIRFEYQPDDFFEYEYAGKIHRYFPDFKIYSDDGTFLYVELKGDHFRDETGKWKNPYRDSVWTDAEYIERCAVYEAKRLCCIKNNVYIMYSAEYTRYENYVNEKYGFNYIKSLRSV